MQRLVIPMPVQRRVLQVWPLAEFHSFYFCLSKKSFDMIYDGEIFQLEADPDFFVAFGTTTSIQVYPSGVEVLRPRTHL